MTAAVVYTDYPTDRRRRQFRSMGLRIHANGVATIDTADARLTVTPGDYLVTDSLGRCRVLSPEAFARARRMNLDT